MDKSIIVAIIIVSAMIFISGCHSQPQKYMLGKDAHVSGMANPASEFCVNSSGTWSVKQDKDGNQQGICTFADSSWCDEWDFYRNNCKPGNNYTSCEGQFWGKTVCPPEYTPVCARIEVGTKAPYQIRYDTFDNACKACISSTKMEVVVGYVRDPCI